MDAEHAKEVSKHLNAALAALPVDDATGKLGRTEAAISRKVTLILADCDAIIARESRLSTIPAGKNKKKE